MSRFSRDIYGVNYNCICGLEITASFIKHEGSIKIYEVPSFEHIKETDEILLRKIIYHQNNGCQNIKEINKE